MSLFRGLCFRRISSSHIRCSSKDVHNYQSISQLMFFNLSSDPSDQPLVFVNTILNI